MDTAHVHELEPHCFRDPFEVPTVPAKIADDSDVATLYHSIERVYIGDSSCKHHFLILHNY